MRVDHCRVDVVVVEQFLDSTDVVAVLDRQYPLPLSPRQTTDSAGRSRGFLKGGLSQLTHERNARTSERVTDARPCSDDRMPSPTRSLSITSLYLFRNIRRRVP
jgi:hypothetical protein